MIVKYSIKRPTLLFLTVVPTLDANTLSTSQNPIHNCDDGSRVIERAQKTFELERCKSEKDKINHP